VKADMHGRILTETEWRERKAAYEERVRPWAEDRTSRMRRGEKHPVHDFLFEYYPFRPSYLLRWSPGFDVLLIGAGATDLGWTRGFEERDGGRILPATAFPAHRVDHLRRTLTQLRAVASREPFFGCFGLHEWAMVYRAETVRHNRVPFSTTARIQMTHLCGRLLCDFVAGALRRLW
jgi:hypothetical protein